MNNKTKKDENTKQYFTKTILISTVIILTSCFFLVELVVGHITRSNALVADSFHIFGDMLSLVVGLVAVRISKRKTSKKNTFGWTRAEVLGSLVNCVLLQALCFTIVIESVTRFLEPEPIEKVDLLLLVGGARLTLNIITLSLFSLYKYKERKNKAKKDMNMNLQSVFLNALGDSLGSVAVIVSGLIIKFAPPKDVLDVKWKLYIDPILSLVIAAIIVSSTIPLIKKSSIILLQGVPLTCDIDDLQKKISAIQGVVDVHHFHVWSLNAEKLVATAHVRLTGDFDEKNKWLVVEKIKKIFHKENIHLTTIQLEHDEASIESCDEECPESIRQSKPSESKYKDYDFFGFYSHRF